MKHQLGNPRRWVQAAFALVIVLGGVLAFHSRNRSKDDSVTHPTGSSLASLRVVKAAPVPLFTSPRRSGDEGLPEFPPIPARRTTKSAPAHTALNPTPAASAAVLSAGRKLELSRTDLVTERDGIFGYVGENFGITLDRGWITLVTPQDFEDIGQPAVAYQLAEMRIGSTLLARGGRKDPNAFLERRSVSYARGSVEERYSLKPGSVEQDFLIQELPAAKGDLTITGTVSTNLAPPEEGSMGPSLAFTHQGQPVIEFSKALALDATGRTIALDMTYQNGRLSLRVPAWWVECAKLPITVDPALGSPITVDSSAPNPGTKRGPAVSFNTSTNCWLTCWCESFGGSNFDYNVYAQLVDRTGVLVGGLIGLGVSTAAEQEPAVCYAPAPINRWLVAWEYDPAQDGGATQVIQGCVLNGDGSTNKAPFAIGGSGMDLYPAIAFDGNQWHVSWEQASGGGGTLLGVFVTTAGTLGAAANVQTTSTPSMYYRGSAFSGGRYAFIWSNYNSNQIFARTMDTSGNLSSVVTVGQGSSFTYGVDVCAGNNAFLFLWQDYTFGMQGRISDINLNFTTSAFIIGSTWGRAAFSQTSQEWVVTYINGSLQAIAVTPPGMLGAAEVVVPAPASPDSLSDPAIGWNSADDNMLIVYRHNHGSLTNVSIEAVMERLPAPPPPSAPTGLTATPGDSQVTLIWTAQTGASQYYVFRSTSSGGSFNNIGSSSTIAFVDNSAVNGTTYYYEVAAYNLGGGSGLSSQVSATPHAPTLIPVLFVVGNTTLGTGDSAIRTRLQNQGYTVVVKGDSASVTSDATGKALVVISSTVTSGNVNTKFTNVAVPVLNWEPSLMNPLGMTGGTSGTNFGTITGQTQVSMAAANASHPMAAGLTNTPTVLASANTFTFGQPNGNATVIANLPSDASKAVIWVYEQGAAMPGLIAPAKRIGFFLYDTTPANLNANGASLFDAAVRYAVGAPAPILTVAAQGSKGSISISWDVSAGALAYNVYRSTSPPAPGQLGQLLASGLSGNSFTDSTIVANQSYYYTVVPFNGGGFAPAAFSAVVQGNGADSIVATLGPAYIRRLPPASETTEYCTGTYQALVKYTDATGVSTVLSSIDARDWDLTLTPPWWWGELPGLPIGGISWPSQVWNMTLSATQNQGDGKMANEFRPSPTRYPGAPIAAQTFTVKSRTKAYIQVWLKFPGNSPGRTLRKVKNAQGVLLDPYEIVQSTGALTSNAQSARGIMADQVRGWLRTYWAQGCVDFYVESDQTPPGKMQITGFNAGGQFVDMNGKLASADFNKLESDKTLHTGGAINLWLMQSLASGFAGEALYSGSTTAIVTDMAVDEPSATVVSHEVGHCLGLDDAENIVLDGPINNTQAIEGTAAAQKRLLMLHAGCSAFPAGGWLPISQVEKARNTATDQTYPAYRTPEPGP